MILIAGYMSQVTVVLKVSTKFGNRSTSLGTPPLWRLDVANIILRALTIFARALNWLSCQIGFYCVLTCPSGSILFRRTKSMHLKYGGRSHGVSGTLLTNYPHDTICLVFHTPPSVLLCIYGCIFHHHSHKATITHIEPTPDKQHLIFAGKLDYNIWK